MEKSTTEEMEFGHQYARVIIQSMYGDVVAQQEFEGLRRDSRAKNLDSVDLAVTYFDMEQRGELPKLPEGTTNTEKLVKAALTLALGTLLIRSEEVIPERSDHLEDLTE